MKNFKFEKPFSSFEQSHEHRMKPLKERWRMALHDPGFLILYGGMLIIMITWIICLI